MQTIVIWDSLFNRHNPGNSHPESPERFSGFETMLQGLPDNVSVCSPTRIFALSELIPVHDVKYVCKLIHFIGINASLDEETILSPDSIDVALRAAGACVELVESIFDGTALNGFALVRPPGHHAEKSRGMGYCIFNNASLAATRARQLGAQRVLIVDLDAHRGNGTQQIFAGCEDVKVFSIHQQNLFPTEELPEDAPGAELSVPLAPGSGYSEYQKAFDQILMPFAEQYRPDFLIVSAGFDAHVNDPMSDLRLTTPEFAMLCSQLVLLAERHCKSRLALILEGGYDLESLKNSIRACIEVIARV